MLANLSRVDLCGAKLTDADLSGANLSEANLIKADLSGANLTAAWVVHDQLLEAQSLINAVLPRDIISIDSSSRRGRAETLANAPLDWDLPEPADLPDSTKYTSPSSRRKIGRTSDQPLLPSVDDGDAARQRARGVPTTRKTRPSWSIKFTPVMRFAAVVLIALLGLATLGGGAIWAASNSLPGDLLYPLKLKIEDARLALTSAPEDQVELALQFVEERTDEVQALAVAGRPVPEETIARMEQQIARALTQAQAAVGERDELLTQIVARTRTQAQKLEQTSAGSSPPLQVGLRRAASVCQQGAAAAGAAIGNGPNPEPPKPTREPQPATPTP